MFCGEAEQPQTFISETSYVKILFQVDNYTDQVRGTCLCMGILYLFCVCRFVCGVGMCVFVEIQFKHFDFGNANMTTNVSCMFLF